MKMTTDLKEIEKIMDLMSKYKIDSFKSGELELRKSKFDMPKAEKSDTNEPASLEEYEKLLFHSAPTIEDIELGPDFMPRKRK